MNVRHHISSQLEHFTESELEEVARYLAFVKFRAKAQKTPVSNQDKWAALYGEAAEEDEQLAQAGMSDYAESLAAEDAK